MDQNIERRVKELVMLSLDSTDFRASLVVALLEDGMYEQALHHALPLIGTTHAPWFLYVRAWHYLSKGEVFEAHELLDNAYRSLTLDSSEYLSQGFSFRENGKPRLASPFNAPKNYGCEPSERQKGSAWLGLSYPTDIYLEDWIALLNNINSNIREYKTVFRSLTNSIERVLHHDLDTVRVAIAAIEFDDNESSCGNYFFLMTMLSDKQLQMVAETLWRVAADWNFPTYMCEITSYFFYLLEKDEIALGLAERGLEQEPASVICGNVRALIYNRSGHPHLADEQWRDTMQKAPERSATYLVVGHQALCSGGLDPALRYFQEAVVIGDNFEEAERFLEAALGFVDDY